MLFHDHIDHLGYLRRYICFTSSLLSMLSTGAVEARSRVPVRLRAWARVAHVWAQARAGGRRWLGRIATSAAQAATAGG